MFCKSLTATQHFARQLSTHLKPSDVVALVGNLSAGKTTFVKALAQGLGVGPQTPVTSPTFTIIQEYPGGRFPLFHIDFYRLEHQKVLEELGLEEYFGGAGVTVVEWADRFPSVFPARTLWLTFEIGEGEERIIHVAGSEIWRNFRRELGEA